MRRTPIDSVKLYRTISSWLGLAVLLQGPTAASGEWSGSVGSELRLFTEDALVSRQDHFENLSLVFELEYNHTWDNGRQSFKFASFLRLDEHDAKRTHGDIRELMWIKAQDNWELRLGIGKVFWGVTESQHLVDIINQTDAIENVDGEDKLGQPMVNLSLVNDWGILSFFVLPGFRERTFAGSEGRLRPQLRVDTDRPIYDSAAEQWHVDFAVRWFHTIGDLDIGVSHFFGTSREPLFVPTPDLSTPSALRPQYDIIHQTSLDAQLTRGDWLWKLEVISRNGQGDRFTAFTAGFEYTFVGAFDTVVDVGILLEYLYDDRGLDANTPFEDDIFFGVRLALNDAPSTDLLAGVIFDHKTESQLYRLEAGRRIGQNLKLSIEAQAYVNLTEQDLQFGLRKDDFIQLKLEWFF